MLDRLVSLDGEVPKNFDVVVLFYCLRLMLVPRGGNFSIRTREGADRGRICIRYHVVAIFLLEP